MKQTCPVALECRFCPQCDGAAECVDHQGPVPSLGPVRRSARPYRPCRRPVDGPEVQGRLVLGELGRLLGKGVRPLLLSRSQWEGTHSIWTRRRPRPLFWLFPELARIIIVSISSQCIVSFAMPCFQYSQCNPFHSLCCLHPDIAPGFAVMFYLVLSWSCPGSDMIVLLPCLCISSNPRRLALP